MSEKLTPTLDMTPLMDGRSKIDVTLRCQASVITDPGNRYGIDEPPRTELGFPIRLTIASPIAWVGDDEVYFLFYSPVLVFLLYAPKGGNSWTLSQVWTTEFMYGETDHLDVYLNYEAEEAEVVGTIDTLLIDESNANFLVTIGDKQWKVEVKPSGAHTSW